jgi:hypothetical protein
VVSFNHYTGKFILCLSLCLSLSLWWHSVVLKVLRWQKELTFLPFSLFSPS